MLPSDKNLGHPYDQSIQQGGKESPCFFILVLKNIFKWQEVQNGIKTKNSGHKHERDRITHEPKKKGLHWKEGQIDLISRMLNEEVEDLCLEDGGNEYVIRKVDALQGMGALITKAADSMSPMKFRMSKADKAPWVDMKFFRNKGTAEGRRHKRFREVVQMYDLHSCEGWSGNKEKVDALHGWASMNLDIMSSRSVAERGMVQGKPNQKSETKICRQRWKERWNIWS